jgi:hypothetical protein
MGRLHQGIHKRRQGSYEKTREVIPIKVVPVHAKLQERTRYLRDWQKQHEQLAVMTGPTKGLGSIGKEVGGMDMEEEVKEAYEVVKQIDVLCVGRCVLMSACFHGGLFVDMSRPQRGQRSGLLPRMPWQGSKTKSLLVYGTNLGRLEMRMRCSESSQNSMLFLYGPR